MRPELRLYHEPDVSGDHAQRAWARPDRCGLSVLGVSLECGGCVGEVAELRCLAGSAVIFSSLPPRGREEKITASTATVDRNRLMMRIEVPSSLCSGTSRAPWRSKRRELDRYGTVGGRLHRHSLRTDCHDACPQR